MLRTIMKRRPAFIFMSLSSIIFVSALDQAVSDSGAAGNASAELPDGRGDINVEATVYTEERGFDKEDSQVAFEESLYPLLRIPDFR